MATWCEARLKEYEELPVSNAASKICGCIGVET